MQKDERFKSWRKKQILLFRYYFRSIRRRFISIPKLLVVLSLIGVFALVLFPSLRARLRDTQIPSQSSFHISGLISQQVKEAERTSNQPIHGALVEVGGFRALSGADGTYDLEFSSPVNSGIPVVFKFGDRESVERVDFPSESTKLKKDFVFK